MIKDSVLFMKLVSTLINKSYTYIYVKYCGTRAAKVFIQNVSFSNIRLGKTFLFQIFDQEEWLNYIF